MMFSKIFLFVLLVEGKLEWKFQIKRGGQEPGRQFLFNQLLLRLDRKKQLYERETVVQKVKNANLRNLLSKMTGNSAENNRHTKTTFKMNNFRNFHKN